MSENAVTEGSTVDQATCPGPRGLPIPLLHFDDKLGSGKLAVSLAEGHAVISTPQSPFDFDAPTIMLSPADRRELGLRLLRETAGIADHKCPNCGHELFGGEA